MHKLRRTSFEADGIFGVFTFDGDDDAFMETLEHAFFQGNGEYAPIIPNGTYTCVRGTHALSNGVPFQTFEITGVNGHSGLLFHAGNFNKDSHGCVLCGQEEVKQANGEMMITGSRTRFAQFMARLDGVQSFQLEVN